VHIDLGLDGRADLELGALREGRLGSGGNDHLLGWDRYLHERMRYSLEKEERVGERALEGGKRERDRK